METDNNSKNYKYNLTIKSKRKFLQINSKSISDCEWENFNDEISVIAEINDLIKKFIIEYSEYLTEKNYIDINIYLDSENKNCRDKYYVAISLSVLILFSTTINIKIKDIIMVKINYNNDLTLLVEFLKQLINENNNNNLIILNELKNYNLQVLNTQSIVVNNLDTKINPLMNRFYRINKINKTKE